ncbi:MAG: hypothetical protein GQ574_19615 [Crocinitomix sp.]|nr:hypothetical protein [Crocinitomix sp.]
MKYEKDNNTTRFNISRLSCSKERPVIPQDYVGNWKCNAKTFAGINVYYYLNINSNGTGNYEKDGFIDDDKVSGDIEISNGILKIKKQTFAIEEVPQLCEGSTSTWEMKVSGLTYSR